MLKKQARNSTNVSFFDSPDGNSPFEFIPPNTIHKKCLDNPFKIEAFLRCESLEGDFSLEGIFKLRGHLIVYYKDEQPALFLNILYARVIADLKSQKPKLQLTKNQASFVFTFEQQNKAKSWMIHLRSVCVQTDFYAQYKSVRLSAKGALTSVHLMKSNTNSELFTIKRFTKDNSMTQKMKASILHEISTINIANHPNLIKFYEIYETESSICLVKEYVAGQTLRSMLQNPNFAACHPDVKSAQIIKPLLSALAYLASKQAIHGSLSPDNIIVDQHGRVKISNLGQINLIENVDSINQEHCAWGYVAPEVFNGMILDDKIDVFSIGCIFFEVLFGTPLFKGQNVAQTLQLNKSFSYEMIFNQICKEIQDSKSPINKQSLELLLRLLEVDPEKRISAEEASRHSCLKSSSLHTSNVNITLFSAACLDSISEQTSKNYLQTPENKRNNLLTPDFGNSNLLINLKSLQNVSSLGGDTINSSVVIGNLSYYDIVDNQRQTYLKKEVVSDDEEDGELIDSDDEKSTRIGAFLENHRIQIALKNPGRLF